MTSEPSDRITTRNGEVEVDDKGVILAGPTESIDESALGFDAWRVPNPDRPQYLLVAVKAQTDGSTDGEILLEVDESGGTAATYDLVLALADSDAGTNARVDGQAVLIIPSGAAYRVVNQQDPAGGNSLETLREYGL